MFLCLWTPLSALSSPPDFTRGGNRNGEILAGTYQPTLRGDKTGRPHLSCTLCSVEFALDWPPETAVATVRSEFMSAAAYHLAAGTACARPEGIQWSARVR